MDTPKRKIAIYGGAFDPPTIAHLFIVTAISARDDVDEVWLLPSGSHPFGKQMAPFAERVAMLEEALHPFNRSVIHICKYEGETDCSGRTYDTLLALSEIYPDCDFLLVMGADNISAAPRWYKFAEITERWKILVFGRPGYENSIQALWGAPWLKLGPSLPDISSTSIRTALEQGEETPWLPGCCKARALRLYGPAEMRARKGYACGPEQKPYDCE